MTKAFVWLTPLLTIYYHNSELQSTPAEVSRWERSHIHSQKQKGQMYTSCQPPCIFLSWLCLTLPSSGPPASRMELHSTGLGVSTQLTNKTVPHSDAHKEA